MPVYRFENLPDVRHNPDLSTAHGPTVKGERIFFGLRFMDAGTGSAPHHHPSEEFHYIISGRARAEINGETNIVGPGGVIHIPADVPHLTAAEPGEDFVYIYVKDTSWGLKGVSAGEETPEKQPEDEKY